MTVSPFPPIRVMLVDDHTMVRKGLALFLKAFDDLELAGPKAARTPSNSAVRSCRMWS